VRYAYGEFDDARGKFLSPDELFPPQGLVELFLEFGQQALDALPDMDADVQRLIDEMLAAGLLERDEKTGRLRITPRMLKGMEHGAFLEIFRQLKPGVREGHDAPEPGRSGERAEGTRPYQFGDPLSEIDANATVRNALRRTLVRPSLDARDDAERAHNPFPLRLTFDDLEVFQNDARTDAAVCVLLDLSGSMARYGRHISAKQVALGLRGLIRRKFPLDTVDFIGFASVARPLRETDLPLVMPEPITTREWDVRVRVPLSEAKKTHPHMTNLHHALRLARATLMRRGAANKHVFIITDGQPTAHLTDTPAGPGHEILNLVYPPSRQTAEATLREAFTLAQTGVRFSSFALIEEYHSMDWIGFVDQLTRLTRGVAFYCAAGDLGAAVMESYLTGKRTKTALR
jgi:Ca-activated chloride channel family protein